MVAIVDTAQTVDSFFWSPLRDLWSFIRLGRTTRPTRIMGISHQIIFIVLDTNGGETGILRSLQR